MAVEMPAAANGFQRRQQGNRVSHIGSGKSEVLRSYRLPSALPWHGSAVDMSKVPLNEFDSVPTWCPMRRRLQAPVLAAVAAIAAIPCRLPVPLR